MQRNQARFPFAMEDECCKVPDKAGLLPICELTLISHGIGCYVNDDKPIKGKKVLHDQAKFLLLYWYGRLYW